MIGHPDGTNLVVDLWSGKQHVCTVPACFELDDVTIFQSKRPRPPRATLSETDEPIQPAPALMIKQVLNWIADNKRAFENLVRRHVTESFNYVDGRKLTGEHAATFFGRPGSRVTVRLAKVRSNPVLHVSPLPS